MSLLLKDVLHVVHGVEEILCDKINMNVLLPAIFKFLFTVPGENDDGSRSDGIAELNIDHAVADDKRGFYIDVKVMNRLRDHAGIRFPAITVLFVLRFTEIRMVRAIIDCIDPCVLFPEDMREVAVNF